MSSGGGGSSTTTSVRELSPEQAALIGLVQPVAEQFVNFPPTQYPFSQIAGFNPTQLAGQDVAIASALGAIPNTLFGAQGASSALLGQNLGTSLGGQAQVIGGALDPTLLGQSALIGQGLQNAFGAQGQILSPENIAATQNAQNFLLGPALFTESNPALQGAINAAIRPVTQQFGETVLPGIRDEFVSAGGLGGSRQGIAEGIASRALLDQIGSISSDLANQNYLAGLNALAGATASGQALQGQQIGANLGAAGGAVGQGFGALSNLIGGGLEQGARALFNAPSLASAFTLPAQVLGGVGSQQQALEQAQLSEQANRFLTEQILPFLAAQEVAGLAFGIPAGSQTTRGSSQQSISPLQSGLGLGALGLGLGGPLFGLGGLIGGLFL